MLIRKICGTDIASYDDLAEKYGTVFNTTRWLKMFGDKIQIYGIYDKGDNLIGGFATYMEKKFGLRIYRNPPFTPLVGPFLNIESQKPVSIMSKWKKALSLMADHLESLPYAVISVSLGRNIVDTQPFRWRKFKVIPGYTYILDLSNSIKDIETGMSAERRNDISKATRDGLTTKLVDDYSIVKSLVLKTFSRQEIVANEYYLNKILFEFANKSNNFATVAFKNDCPLAASFCVYDNNTAYYLLGGYDSENKHHGAGALSVWEAIKHTRELGLKQFDFEGSMVPQIEMYFREFGGKLTPYYGINKAKLPLEILLKFFKRELF
jgi:hypothetical protein